MMGTNSIVFILLCSSVWTLVLSIEPNDNDIAAVLNKLKNDFRDIRHSNQYAVLYIPPPNAHRGRINYVPRTPQITRGNVILPNLTTNNRNNYQQNYAGSTVDFNGARYGEMLHRRGGHTIHTEDLSLNLVYPGMENWYNARFGTPIRALYLYTHFLPCPRCFEIIQNFAGNHTNIRIYVGYTQLFGGMWEGDNVTLQHNTTLRRDSIQNFLNNIGGRLLQVEDRGVCNQAGVVLRFGRDASNICPATTEMFVITMDFTTGKAQVWFNNITYDYNGWFELLDINDERLTWEWTYGKTDETITFNTYIQNGAYVKYWSNDKRVIRQSYPWDGCGFGFVKLNVLPYNVVPPPRFSMIKLTMMDGYLTVFIKKSPNYMPNSWDWVVIQSLDQINTENYQTWQWVSKFTEKNDYFYYQFTRLGSAFTEGFRAKYVFYDGTQYRFEGTYDNASPIWTPGQCQGGACMNRPGCVQEDTPVVHGGTRVVHDELRRFRMTA